VCPVDIDLPRMLLELRKDLVEEGETSLMWDWSMKGFAFGMGSPMVYGLGGRMARLGTKFMGNNLPGVLGNWTQNREFPDFAPKPFRQLWRERQQARVQRSNGADSAGKASDEHQS
jgi:L-lactate dehydrogenase complex protein LldF